MKIFGFNHEVKLCYRIMRKYECFIRGRIYINKLKRWFNILYNYTYYITYIYVSFVVTTFKWFGWQKMIIFFLVIYMYLSELI